MPMTLARPHRQHAVCSEYCVFYCIGFLAAAWPFGRAPSVRACMHACVRVHSSAYICVCACTCMCYNVKGLCPRILGIAMVHPVCHALSVTYLLCSREVGAHLLSAPAISSPHPTTTRLTRHYITSVDSRQDPHLTPAKPEVDIQPKAHQGGINSYPKMAKPHGNRPGIQPPQGIQQEGSTPPKIILPPRCTTCIWPFPQRRRGGMCASSITIHGWLATWGAC